MVDIMAYQNTIVTHSDTFHCDEVFATALLKQVFDLTEVCRTRNQAEILNYKNGENNYIVDVGKLYEPLNNCFDHHQAKKVDTFSGKNEDTPLSSFGMVWKHHGEKLVAKLIPKSYATDNRLISEIWRKFYHNFVEHIDANDNGVSCSSGTNIPIYTLPQLIGEMNRRKKPGDYDDGDNDNESDDEIGCKICLYEKEQLNAFNHAVEEATIILLRHLTCFIESQIAIELNCSVIQLALDNRIYTEILVLKEYIDDGVTQILDKLDPLQSVKFIVVYYQHNNWKIWTRPVKGQRFKHLVSIASEKYFKEHRPELEDKIIFVHQTGFTGAAKTPAVAVDMALTSLVIHARMNEYVINCKIMFYLCLIVLLMFSIMVFFP